MAVGHVYADTSFGRYGKETTASEDIKRSVEQEVNWFGQSYGKPYSVHSHPSNKSIIEFQSLIHDSKPHRAEIPGYGMAPDELSRLCVTRHISHDHFMQMTEQFNAMQKNTCCIYSITFKGLLQIVY